MQMFCLKEKKKVEVDEKDLKEERLPNGRKMLKGICPSCGTKLSKFTK